ncbi:hypothetical protein ACM66B_003169 [Microbotryomycetes sp. NB124-2]
MSARTIKRPSPPLDRTDSSVVKFVESHEPPLRPTTIQQANRLAARASATPDSQCDYVYTLIGTATALSLTNALHLLHDYEDLVYYTPGALAKSSFTLHSPYDFESPGWSPEGSTSKNELVGRLYEHMYSDTLQADRELPLASKLKLFCNWKTCLRDAQLELREGPAIKFASLYDLQGGIKTEICGPDAEQAVTGEINAFLYIIGDSQYVLVRGQKPFVSQQSVNNKAIAFAKEKFGDGVHLFCSYARRPGSQGFRRTYFTIGGSRYDAVADSAGNEMIGLCTTILGLARRTLWNSGLPTRLWYQAVQAAVFTHNLLIQERSQRLPTYDVQLEYWTDVSDLSWHSRLRVFGCQAYVPPSKAKIESARANNLSCEWRRVRFVGYRFVGWLFWDPETDEVFVSTRATFFETSFEDKGFDPGSTGWWGR